MAVSGENLPDFQSSVSKGPAEDLNQECDPCLSDGQHEDAHGNCVDCKEYLCKNCLKFHQKTKALNHHQLLNIDNMGEQKSPSTTSQACPEKCTRHADKVIQFFCREHKELGCHVCMTIDHRTCKIDYIPDTCAGIGDSEEYKGTIWLINQRMKKINSVMKKATARDMEIDVCYDNLTKEIVKFRKEINDRLDQLQKQLEKEADRKKSDDKQIIEKALQTCTNVSADMNKYLSCLSSNNQSKQNGKLYINMKKAQSKLKSDEIEKAEETLEKTNMQYNFERNKNVEDVLSKPNILGNLNLSDTLGMPRKKVDKLIKKEDINVRTKSDTGRYYCSITGCAVLSSNKLVLADSCNSKLKVVDIQSKTVTEEKKLDTEPCDIATMPGDQIAVSLPDNSEVIIMKAASNLTTVHKIPVKCNCYGISYHQDHLYVVCQNPNSVLVLDTQGNVQNTISLNNDIFKYPRYIVVSEDSRHIYISDWGSNCTVCITLQGDVSAVYKHEKLRQPQGMLLLDDGSLLVCCYRRNTIHHISGDLKQGKKMTDGLSYPKSICYSHHHDEGYIGCDSNHLKSYNLK
ncbi:uncharacterized protein LOC123535981 [Mercenaria mercenaria]|uniref:uncharacterized protein LOC123535981 n=1 Tax=Mercenaria mercenaria TaxID=6596 RepID=UPI00234E5E10|nr:uncharacterized protein LOC123535981 [Mercenaria mercenaria]